MSAEPCPVCKAPHTASSPTGDWCNRCGWSSPGDDCERCGREGVKEDHLTWPDKWLCTTGRIYRELYIVEGIVGSMLMTEEGERAVVRFGRLNDDRARYVRERVALVRHGR